ncbi:MAG: fluoride efflux transporter CrcB [Thermoanaerobaculia bacterium]|nr:fluoride efflux transporter CrcB [Thermoanaerobaculia bacterium]
MNAGIAVAGGGALGAWLRFLVTGWVHRLPWPEAFADRFPVGTFVVNLTGCLIVGLLAGLFYDRLASTSTLRAFLMMGVLGGYTTFSSFALESVRLLQAGDWSLATLNVVGSPALGLLGAWVGLQLAQGAA